MIRSFRDKATEALYHGTGGPVLQAGVRRRALARLDQLDRARQLRDLQVPRGNRLKRLSGDRAGQWSIRVNDQYRVCFEWIRDDAWEVELTKHYGR